MYGVVICPRCNQARGVDLGSRTASCPRCGNRIDLRKAYVYARVDDQRLLPEAVRRVSESNRGLEAFESGPAPRPRPVSGPETVGSTVRALSADGPFSVDELARTMDVDVGRAKAIVEAMMAEGELMEPSAGRYRTV